MTIRRPYRPPAPPSSTAIVCQSCKRPLGELRNSGVTKIPRAVFIRADGRLQCQCPACEVDIVLPYERTHG